MSDLLSPDRFILNTAPVKLKWKPHWRIFDLDFRDWDNRYYQKLRIFRQEYHSDDFILDNTGRKLCFLSFEEPKVADDMVQSVIDELERDIGSTITIEEILIEDINSIEDEYLQNTITNAMGEYLSYLLQDTLNFEKTGSHGSVGRYFHHEYSSSVTLSKSPPIDIVTHFEFTLNIEWHHKFTPYLSIDLKSEVKGEQSLYELMQSKPSSERTDVSSYKKDQLYWSIPESLDLAEWKEIFSIEFELVSILSYEDGKNKQTGLIDRGKYKDKTLGQIMSIIKFKPRRGESIAELKLRKGGNPNKRYYFPCSLLTQPITNSYIKDKPFENKFHQLSKPSISKRKELISKIFSILEDVNITDNMMEFRSNYPAIAYPSVNGNYNKEYGKIPQLSKTGMQEWGNLSNVVLYYHSRNKDLAQETSRDLKTQLNHVGKKSKTSVTVESRVFDINQVRKEAARSVDQPEATLYVFIRGRGKGEPSYAKMKEWFTAENGKPVQFFRVPSLFNNRRRSTIQTAIPQLIAKTGGLPFELSPKILDKALIIGLDKGRDSHSTTPSASAGVAAVTPRGEYIAGASTKIDTTKHDSIDVDELAPDLLEKLVERYGTYLEYVVILRDGSPEIAKDEVEPWKRHLEKHNLKMIFFASRKENPYRVFPRVIHDERRTRYKLPVILHDAPLDPSDFLVITANPVQGTPRPVLYTLMENTTTFSEEEIMSKVIPQVLSMSMLCWESPLPTSQPLPLHYADKLAEFSQTTKMKWRSSIKSPQFI